METNNVPQNIKGWYEQNVGAEAASGQDTAATHVSKNRVGKLLSTFIAFVCTAMLVLGLTTLVFADDSGDIEPPSDVENVQAEAGDGNVFLFWDVATDNVGVVGYKLYYGLESVTGEGGGYLHEIEVGDVIDYLVEDLENDVTYYFAVTAYDAAGNESESYSIEQAATPAAEAVEVEVEPAPLGDDGKAPTVKSSESFSNVQVKVTFSEAIQLPADEPQTAFLIQDNLTGDFLPLLDAEILNDDPKSVVLETAAQEIGIEYIVTAGFTVEDEYGNSVRSGTSDTATFVGGTGDYIPVNVDMPEVLETDDILAEGDAGAVLDAGAEALAGGMEDAFADLYEGLSPEEIAELEAALGEAAESGDITGGTILGDAEGDDLPEVGEEPTEFAEIGEEGIAGTAPTYDAAEGNLPAEISSLEAVSDTDIQVVFSEAVSFVEAETHFVVTDEDDNVLEVSSEELMTDGFTALFTVEGMEPGKDYVLSIMNVVTELGAAVDSADGIAFEAATLELVDMIPPEEITNLLSFVEGTMVRLTWNVSVSEDAIEQLVYESMDGDAFEIRTMLPPLVAELEMADLTAGMTYWFKITSKDAAGNESEGVTVQVTLPETGPGLALAFGLSALGTAAVRRRKKNV